MSKIDSERAFVPVNIAILTVSDSRNEQNDKSGNILIELLKEAGHHLVDRKIVLDQREDIIAQLKLWIANPKVDAVIATGGTGVTGRDVTPEAFREVYEKEILGFGELFRLLRYSKIGTATIQSRATAGVAGETYLFALPGSPNACKDAWEQILKFQLDSRHRPCNFVELMPRLREEKPISQPQTTTISEPHQSLKVSAQTVDVSLEKSFVQRQVLSADELRRRLSDRIVLGFSGYTKPPPNSNYERNAEKLVVQILEFAIERWGYNVALVYGSSDGGIDQIVERVCRSKPFAHLPLYGLTCPEFMEWVPDQAERPPIAICTDVNGYAELFIELLSILVITGGRAHTIRHDLMALDLGKQVLVCDCAPSHRPNVAEGKVENAAGLLSEHLHIAKHQGDVTERISHLFDSLNTEQG
jgi:molybdenum cofactor biosynthesis protein B